MAIVGIPRSTGSKKALTRAQAERKGKIRTGQWAVPLMERAKKSA